MRRARTKATAGSPAPLGVGLGVASCKGPTPPTCGVLTVSLAPTPPARAQDVGKFDKCLTGV